MFTLFRNIVNLTEIRCKFSPKISEHLYVAQLASQLGKFSALGSSWLLEETVQEY